MKKLKAVFFHCDILIALVAWTMALGIEVHRNVVHGDADDAPSDDVPTQITCADWIRFQTHGDAQTLYGICRREIEAGRQPCAYFEWDGRRAICQVQVSTDASGSP